MKRFLRSTEGSTIVPYALAVAVIGAAVVGSLYYIGVASKKALDTSGNAIQAAVSGRDASNPTLVQGLSFVDRFDMDPDTNVFSSAATLSGFQGSLPIFLSGAYDVRLIIDPQPVTINGVLTTFPDALATGNAPDCATGVVPADPSAIFPVSTSGTVRAGSHVYVCLTTPPLPAAGTATASATVTVGDASDEWRVTTRRNMSTYYASSAGGGDCSAPEKACSWTVARSNPTLEPGDRILLTENITLSGYEAFSASGVTVGSYGTRRTINTASTFQLGNGAVLDGVDVNVADLALVGGNNAAPSRIANAVVQVSSSDASKGILLMGRAEMVSVDARSVAGARPLALRGVAGVSGRTLVQASGIDGNLRVVEHSANADPVNAAILSNVFASGASALAVDLSAAVAGSRYDVSDNGLAGRRIEVSAGAGASVRARANRITSVTGTPAIRLASGSGALCGVVDANTGVESIDLVKGAGALSIEQLSTLSGRNGGATVTGAGAVEAASGACGF